MKKYLLLIILLLVNLASFGQINISLSGYPLVTTGWLYSSSPAGPAAAIDSTFRLTNSTTSTSSYIYYNTAINIAAWCQWTAEFDFKITPSTGTIADGFAFWFLSNPPTASSTGSSIALPSFPNGLILIFDTYDNNSTPAENPQISLLGYNGTVSGYTEGSATGRLCNPLNGQGWIRDGNWHHAKITYFLGNIRVYFDYSATPNMSSTAPYMLTMNGYFGFTGSTGAVTSTQSIKRVAITVDDCLTPSNNGPICQGDTLKLFATGDSTGATYSWYGPNSFSSTSQNPIRTGVTYADSGDYYVIKTFGGVPDTEMTHVSIKLTPDVTASSNSPVCYGGTINLSATAFSATGETYSWTGPGTFTSAVQNPTITPAALTDTGNYTVITTLDGCHDTASVHVNVILVPVPWDSSNAPICEGNTLYLFATDSMSGVSWSWSGPGYTSSSQNPTLPGATTANSGVYTVTATFGSCFRSDTLNVRIDRMPAMPAIVPMVRICTGQTISLLIDPITLDAGATYHWIGPNGYTSTFTNNSIPNAIMANGGIYSVYATIGVCGTDTTHNFFQVDSTPEVPSIANNGPICSDSVIRLFSSDNTDSVNFSWTGPGGYTSNDQNPVIYGAATTMSGNYTVTATLHLCHNDAITTLIVNQRPINPVVGSNSPVCEKGMLSLQASFSPYTGVFHWTGPNGFSSLTQNPTILNVPMAATGTYWVHEELNGCTSDTVPVNVVIEPTPAVPVATSNAPICQGDTLKLFAYDDTAGVTYSWNGPNLFSSVTQNPYIINVTPAAGGIYTLTAILGNCSAVSSTNVAITSTPTITATSNSPVCSGDTLKFVATSAPGNTFAWTGPYTYFASGPAPMRYPAIMEYNGSYTVVTTEPGGCIGTAVVDVVINPTPPAPWITWLTFCQYDYAPPLMPVDATNVLWFSSSSGGTGTTTPPIPNTNTPGIYFYYLNQTVNGCTSPIDSIQVVVNPKPNILVTPADTSVCPRDSIVYRTTISDPLASVRWTPSLYLSDTTGGTVVSHPEGNINYLAIVTDLNHCSDTAIAQVTVYPAALISIPVIDSIILSPGETYHIQPITNCSSISWFPPEGLSSPLIADPVASPDINTMYIATGVTENGCVVRDSIYFHVNPDNTYGIPNAFTPGTGSNNVFKIIVEGQAKLNYFRVFNRWGEMLFETKDINEGWDGTYKGEPQPFGVYVYDIQTVSSVTGKIKSMRGNITLLR